jgi:hypothetical protein
MIGLDGDDLVLEASTPPPAAVLDALSRHKAGIVALLRPPNDGWIAEDWQVFFDERAGIAEFDGKLPRPEVEARAFECCIVEWLNRHPQHSDPGRCAWCGKPDRHGHAVVPFGTKNYGPTWLHPECWNDWGQDWRERAQLALTVMGLNAPPKCAKETKFLEDFGKYGRCDRSNTKTPETCVHCGQPIDPGQEIAPHGAGGEIHMRCMDDWQVSFSTGEAQES